MEASRAIGNGGFSGGAEIIRQQERLARWEDSSGRSGGAWRLAVELFWVFSLASVLGLLMEQAAHLAAFHEWQGREGLLFGPFSPIYGVGGVCVLLLSKALGKAPLPIAFLAFAAAGGAVEFAASYIMQNAFGILAWDYTGTFLSIGGRTNGPFMAVWGVLGVLFMKFALPAYGRFVGPVVGSLPRAANACLMVLMAANIALTLASFDCWYMRLDGNPVDTPAEAFFEEHFGNDYMDERFDSMSLFPQDARHA